MPPIFSRPRSDPLGFPVDVWLEIIRLLNGSERRLLMVTCKAMHNVVASVMYRTLVVQERLRPRAVRLKRTCCVPPLLANSILPCLFLSAQNNSGWSLNRRYAVHVKSLTVVSYTPVSNLRVIPILIHVLRHATALRFLRIEVCDESIPLLLALLLRSSFIRMPTLQNTLDASTISSPHTILYLPALKGFRTNHYEVAGCMLQLRALEVLVVDGAVVPNGFPRFLQGATTGASSLTSLSLTLAGPGEFLEATVQATMLSFPNLEYLSFRLDSQYLFQSMVAMLDLLQIYHQSLPRVRCVAINQGELSRHHDGEHLLGFRHRLDQVSKDRHRFVMVIMGSSRLARKNEYSSWIFTEYCFDYMWPWLFRSQ